MRRFQTIFATVFIAILACAGSALADVAPPPSDPVGRTLNSMLEHALEPLMYMVLAIAIAAPAVASMLLLWLGRRWPRLESAVWIGAVAGVVTTFFSGWVVGTVIGVASDAFGVVQRNYQTLPYFAGVLVAIAVWLQIRERATFSRGRAAELVAAVMTPVVLAAIQAATYM